MSIIISDFLTDNNYEQAIDYLVSKRRDLFCFQVLSKEELKPTIRGKVHFYDSEDNNMQYRKNINKDVSNAYNKALEYAGLTGNETILDLYCGVGTLGINASKNAKKAFGFMTTIQKGKEESTAELERISGLSTEEAKSGTSNKDLWFPAKIKPVSHVKFSIPSTFGLYNPFIKNFIAFKTFL